MYKTDVIFTWTIYYSTLWSISEYSNTGTTALRGSWWVTCSIASSFTLSTRDWA